MSRKSLILSLLLVLPFLGLEMSPLPGDWTISIAIWSVFLVLLFGYHVGTIRRVAGTIGTIGIGRTVIVGRAFFPGRAKTTLVPTQEELPKTPKDALTEAPASKPDMITRDKTTRAFHRHRGSTSTIIQSTPYLELGGVDWLPSPLPYHHDQTLEIVGFIRADFQFQSQTPGSPVFRLDVKGHKFDDGTFPQQLTNEHKIWLCVALRITCIPPGRVDSITVEFPASSPGTLRGSPVRQVPVAGWEPQLVTSFDDWVYVEVERVRFRQQYNVNLIVAKDDGEERRRGFTIDVPKKPAGHMEDSQQVAHQKDSVDAPSDAHEKVYP